MTASGPSRRLDILVLGPMTDGKRARATGPIHDALRALLAEAPAVALLGAMGVNDGDWEIHLPEGLSEQEIVHSVLSKLDCADLVIINITPKPGRTECSPNVFYEVALVHALGIPAFFVVAGEAPVPFYAQSTRLHRVPRLTARAAADALRGPLREFLDVANRSTDFTDDRVSQFFGMPIVDISAAVGLATGYYFNFASRLIAEGGFLASHPDKIRHVVVVRPSGVDSTYPADKHALETALAAAGYTLTNEKLQPPAGDPLGPIWFDHVDGVVLDIPRTIYPLQRSPRLLSMRQRNARTVSDRAKHAYELRVQQVGEHLLDRVEDSIRYQMQFDGQRVRSRIVHFATIQNAPSLVGQLSRR